MLRAGSPQRWTTNMRALPTTLLVIVAALASFAPARAAEVEVISGDVIRVGDNEWRIANIDAPQTAGTCQAEMKLGLLAQAKLAEFLAQGDMEIAPTGERDEHQRRTARVRMNGEDIGDKMLAISLAQRHGQARSLCKAHSGLDNFQRTGNPMQGMRGRGGMQ